MNILSQNTSGIYQIENTITGHRYIGSAINIQKRWKEHILSLHKNKHHSQYLQRAWNKYGEEYFAFSIIEICFPFALIFREQYFIDQMKPEYNISKTAGSTLGYKHSLKARNKMSLALTGRKRSPEFCAKQHERKTSPETRAKLSLVAMGRPRLPETRVKMSEERLRFFANGGKNGKSKSVEQYAIDGTYIARYESTRAAERATGIAQSGISDCCNGKLKTSGGFKWTFAVHISK